MQAAEPERSLFRKKSTPFRIAAIQGLAEARTSQATEALRTLQDDEDQEVRSAAAHALGRIARSSGGSSSAATAP